MTDAELEYEEWINRTPAASGTARSNVRDWSILSAAVLVSAAYGLLMSFWLG